jgi:hypothetical protein
VPGYGANKQNLEGKGAGIRGEASTNHVLIGKVRLEMFYHGKKKLQVDLS